MRRSRPGTRYMRSRHGGTGHQDRTLLRTRGVAGGKDVLPRSQQIHDGPIVRELGESIRFTVRTHRNGTLDMRGSYRGRIDSLVPRGYHIDDALLN